VEDESASQTADFAALYDAIYASRDDAGFWNQIERYIQEHSEAKFSHGICPECERKVREQMEEENLLPRSPLESQKTPS